MKKLLLIIIGLALLSKTDAFAVWYWDTNGDTPGSGITTSPSGTWGVDPFWAEDNLSGEKLTGAWVAGKVAAFSAGSDAIAAYTVYVSGIVTVADIHVDRGEVTFEPAPETGGSLQLGSLLSVGGFDDYAVARYNVPITDATSVIRYKVGTLIFGATNTFTGSLTIESGFTQCAVPNCFSAAPSLVLANLTMSRDDISTFWENYDAVLQTGGLDEQFGTLQFAGTNSVNKRVLDLGNGSGTLSFADSSAEDWTESIYGFNYTLTIQNYALGSSKLRFGTTGTGLTATQLSQMKFVDFGDVAGVIDGDGYVTPAPAAPPQPTITAITHSGGSVQIDWTAVSGKWYNVWTKDTLTAASWDGPAAVQAAGATASYTDSLPSATARYYRVEALP